MYCSLFVSVIGIVVAVVGVILGWGVFPGLVDDKIAESVELVDGTDQYKRWEVIPFPIEFKVYLFNVSNPEEIKNGAKPIVKEVGPYIYSQSRKKFNITGKDGVLSYYQRQLFTFNKTLSGSYDEDDIVTVYNVALHAIVQATEMDSPALLGILNLNLKKVFGGEDQLTITTRVRDLLFDGIPLCATGPGAICNKIREKDSKTMREENGTLYFSFFEFKNNSHDGYYQVATGERDPKDLARIMEWENSPTLSFWPERHGNNSICNMINGTDASIFAPFVSKNDIVQIFSTDICRSVDTRFSHEVEYKSIRGLRFAAYEDMLPAPAVENGTDCFCANVTKGIVQENGCLKNGAMELFPCLDAHIVATFPHLWTAHKDYQNSVEGLQPDPEKHQIILDLEPNTGVPLRGFKRIQFNMFSRPVRSITITSNVSTALFPILWVDEGLELPDDIIEMLNDDLFDVLVILDAVTWTLIAVGLAWAIVWIIYALYTRHRANKKASSEVEEGGKEAGTMDIIPKEE